MEQMLENRKALGIPRVISSVVNMCDTIFGCFRSVANDQNNVLLVRIKAHIAHSGSLASLLTILNQFENFNIPNR